MSRRSAVIGVGALGAGFLGVSAAPWLSVEVSTAISDDSAVVAGAGAVPAVQAAGLVLLAAALALALAGRVAQIAAAVAIVAVGLLAVVGIQGFLADPAPVAGAAVAEMTGVRTADVVPTVTAWPMVALVLATVAAATGVGVLLLSRRWSRSAGARYERPPVGTSDSERAGEAGNGSGSVAQPDAMTDWDALSRGEDPS